MGSERESESFQGFGFGFFTEFGWGTRNLEIF